MRLSRRDMLRLASAAATATAVQRAAGQADGGDGMQVPTPAPRIARFEESAYGMFVHWGLFSFRGRCVWGSHPRHIPISGYTPLANLFTASDFNPRLWARTAREAGMKYITLTSRQHDGFSLYDTRGLSDYDAPHSAPKRDLIAEYVEGCRAEGMKPFLYHTLYDWYQPSFTEDFDAYLDYLHQSIEILCTHYGELGGFWFDGTWSKPAGTDWKEDRLYGIIRKRQPEAIIINNTGVADRGVLGHPEIDCVTYEMGYPEPMDRAGMTKYVAAEMCETMNTLWGIVPNDYNYISPKGIIEDLCACRKVGANLLLNVGPTPEGAIPDYEAAALERAGGWVEKHANAVRRGRPCGVAGPGRDFGLEADGKLYLFCHHIAPRPGEEVTTGVVGPGPRTFTGVEREVRSARWLDTDEGIEVSRADDGGLTIEVTQYPAGWNSVVRVAEVG